MPTVTIGTEVYVGHYDIFNITVCNTRNRVYTQICSWAHTTKILFCPFFKALF